MSEPRSGQPGDYGGHTVTWGATLADLAALSDVIVLSIRPQDWPALGLTAPDKLVISVMAGVPLRALPPRTIRALPNAAAMVDAAAHVPEPRIPTRPSRAAKTRRVDEKTGRGRIKALRGRVVDD